jgi:hypothetical protein
MQFKITPLNRPVANHAWMHIPSTPEQQAASEGVKLFDTQEQAELFVARQGGTGVR